MKTPKGIEYNINDKYYMGSINLEYCLRGINPNGTYIIEDLSDGKYLKTPMSVSEFEKGLDQDIEF